MSLPSSGDRPSAMQLQIVSDLHIDTQPDGGMALLQSLCQTRADILIVAGDFAEVRRPEWFSGFQFLSRHYPQVIAVLGNHEYYHSTPAAVAQRCQAACLLLPNFRVLENEVVAIADLKIAGTTLWYPYRQDNERYEHMVGDFPHLERHWIYNRNQEALNFLESVEADIWITHYLPSWQSIHSRWLGSEINRFFVCDIESLILEKQPQLVIHGHTHYPTQYRIGKSQILCNPFGYPGEDDTQFQPQLVLTLQHSPACAVPISSR